VIKNVSGTAFAQLKEAACWRNLPQVIENMFNIKSTVTTVIIGIVAVIGVEAYGFYSIRHMLDTRLGRLENGIESVRATDMAMTSKIEAQAANKEPIEANTKDAKGSVGNQQIILNRKAAVKVQKMLPARTNLNEAVAGFKNQTQFISAVCVSKDLGIPFARLKAKITGNHAVSIEAAIRELRPDLNKAKAKAEVEKGQRQAVEIAKLGKPGSSLT
jgi:hypothetical protein